MIYNEAQNNVIQNNNRIYKGSNYNANNAKIPRRKNKIKLDNNNNYQEITEFKSKEDLLFLSKLKPTKSFEPYTKNQKAKGRNLINDSNNNLVYNKTNIINEYKGNNEYSINKELTKSYNKSNSSVKINTKINSKKFFISKKLGDYNTENMPEHINNNKKVVKSSSNNFNIVCPGQNSVKMTGKKMINYYNNSENNKNNNLTMTKSSIQIKGIYPLTQSQNINYQYQTQSKVESIALNVDVDNSNSSQGKYNRKNNIENNNNKTRSIQNRYINNQNYKNKTHLVKREFKNKIINYDNNNNILTPKLLQNKNIKINGNSNLMESIENRSNRVNNNYDNYDCHINNSNRAKQAIHKIKNNLVKSTQAEIAKENQFVKKNNDEYNNIFFYTSNTNTNTNNKENEHKYKYQYREKSDFIYNAMDDDNDDNNYNINIISNKNENKMKSKYIYIKNGNLKGNKDPKLIDNKNNSQTKVSNSNTNDIHINENLHKNLTKDKIQNSNINKNIKKDKSDEIRSLKSKRSYEIKKRQIKENKNFRNYNIKKHEMKIRKKESFNKIDIKIKLPPNDHEEIISINVKEDNINEIIENIIKDYYLDESYYDPLLLLVNNSINILKNIGNIKIYKTVKKDNQKLYKGNGEATSLKEASSEINSLDFSLINDLIGYNKYKEYFEDLCSDYEEIIGNSKMLNMSI